MFGNEKAGYISRTQKVGFCGTADTIWEEEYPKKIRDKLSGGWQSRDIFLSYKILA